MQRGALHGAAVGSSAKFGAAPAFTGGFAHRLHAEVRHVGMHRAGRRLHREHAAGNGAHRDFAGEGDKGSGYMDADARPTKEMDTCAIALRMLNSPAIVNDRRWRGCVRS